MTDQQTISNSDDALRKLMNIHEAYEELHGLLPDETCYRLLGYINQDFKESLPSLFRAMATEPVTE